MARLNHLTLFVRDRRTATDWYVQNLNLEVEFEVPETATTAVRDPGDFTIFLMERSSTDDAPRCALYFEVDDVTPSTNASGRRVPRSRILLARLLGVMAPRSSTPMVTSSDCGISEA